MRVVMTVSNPMKPDPRVYKEAKSLAKAGHEVYVIAWDREEKYSREETIEGVRVIRVGPKAPYGYSMALKLPLFYLNAFKLIIKLKPDVIHTHDFDTALLGLLFKVLKGVKWVYDVHDLYFTFFEMEGNESIVGEFVRKADLLLSKQANHLIVATQSIGGKHEGLREYYVKNGISPEKIITLWNVPDLEEFLKYPKLYLRKSKKFTIGFIGSQRTMSNFLSLFEAVKNESERYKLLFVGEGKTTKKLKKIVKEKYFQLDVEFVGNVDYRLIPNYYMLCDAIYSCFPVRENVKRGLSIKVFEATILGIPVIVNDETLNADYVKRYRCGVCVNVENVKTLKKAIALVRELKPFNVEVIKKTWNWRRMEERLINIYSKWGGKNEDPFSFAAY